MDDTYVQISVQIRSELFHDLERSIEPMISESFWKFRHLQRWLVCKLLGHDPSVKTDWFQQSRTTHPPTLQADQSENYLTHWGRVTHICVSKLAIIGSDNGLSPGRRQAII